MYYVIANKAKNHANLTVQKLHKHGMSAFLNIPKKSLPVHQGNHFTQSSREKAVKNVAELHSSFCFKEWLGKCNRKTGFLSP
jgi:hypothetical protein